MKGLIRFPLVAGAVLVVLYGLFSQPIYGCKEDVECGEETISGMAMNSFTYMKQRYGGILAVAIVSTFLSSWFGIRRKYGKVLVVGLIGLVVLIYVSIACGAEFSPERYGVGCNIMGVGFLLFIAIGLAGRRRRS